MPREEQGLSKAIVQLSISRGLNTESVQKPTRVMPDEPGKRAVQEDMLQ
jgi:hypothetical protein